MKYLKVDETQYEMIDPVTGEITQEAREIKHSAIYKDIDEGEFVKVYYDVFTASLGENRGPLTPFLIEVGKRMTYSEDGQIIVLVKEIKESIARSLGVSIVSVNRLITQCVNNGLFIRTGRSVYAVSPLVMAKGKWQNIRALQIAYDAELKKMKIDVPRPEYLITKKGEVIENEQDG